MAITKRSALLAAAGTVAVGLALVLLAISGNQTVPNLGRRPHHPMLRMLTEPLAKARMYRAIEKADEPHAPSIVDEERAEFDKMDLNLSGAIEFAEFALGAAGVSERDQTTFFGALDADGSGGISFTEFKNSQTDEHMQAIMANIVMNEHDADHDRSLSLAELTAFMKVSMTAGQEEVGDFEAMAADEIDMWAGFIAVMMMQSMDVDGQPGLSLTELTAMFQPDAMA